MFGRKHWRTVLAAFTILSLISPPLHNLIVYTTVRNFEFVVAFLFMAAFLKYAIENKVTKASKLLLIIASALLAIVISGDDYFIYVVLFPSLVMITWLLFIKRLLLKKAMLAISILAAIFLAGKIIYAALPLTHLFIND